MADPLGTTLGALGVVGLVSVCLDCFNFISDGLSVGKDFVLLEAQFSALKIRLLAWTIACGFFKAEGYDKRLDEPLWKQHVQKQLNSISLLFLDAAKLIKRYDLLDRRIQQTRVITIGESTHLIEEGLNDFLKRIKKTKQQAGLRGLFAWALKDKKQFSELNERLGICLDALEQILANLDLFTAAKHSIQAQVNAISDIQSLEEMAGALNDSSGSSIVSDAASQRLVILGHGSILEISTLRTGKTEAETFLTARSRFSRDSQCEFSSIPHNNINNDNNDDDDEDDDNCAYPHFSLSAYNHTVGDITQNVKVMTAILASNSGKDAPMFEPLELQGHRWGEKIRLKKLAYEGSPISLPNLPDDADGRINAILPRRLKKMRAEIGSDDFLALIAISPDLRNIVVAFEGGQGTPYQDGIFYLNILVPTAYPWRPPKMQLLTKVYHPNIDPNGQICMELLTSGWIPISYHIGALVMALVALLDSPSIDDPLVPEIAATYLEDREQYIQNAKMLTKKHAHWDQDIVSILGLQH